MLPIPGVVRWHLLGAGRGRHRAGLIHEPDLVWRERHVALADAQEAAHSHHHGPDLAAAAHNQLTDVADLLMLLNSLSARVR